MDNADETSAKRAALDPADTVKLHIGVLPPNSRESDPTESQESHKRHALRDRLYTARNGQAQPPSTEPTMPALEHLTLPSDDSFLYDLTLRLFPLVLTHFVIVSVEGDVTVCRSSSFDSQQALDAAVRSCVPLNTRLRLSGRVESFTHRQALLDEVHITFELTVSAPEALSQPEPTSRLIHVSEESVRFSIDYHLLPDFVLPLTARPARFENEHGGRCGCNKDGLPFFRFEMDAADAQLVAQRAISLPAILDQHARRVLLSRNEALSKHTFDGKWFSRYSIWPYFLSHCSAARLSSFRLVYSFAGYPTVQSQVEVRSDNDMQLPGFHIVQPRLCFRLDDTSRCEQYSSIRGVAKAWYRTPDMLERAECCTEVRLGEVDRDNTLTVTGDCLSVMRMADILLHNDRQSAAQPVASAAPSSEVTSSTPAPSTSHTLSSESTLPWTLDQLLARQLPWLVPSAPPELPPEGKMSEKQLDLSKQGWNRLECSYDLETHTVMRVKFVNLTLAIADAASPSSTITSASPLIVLLNSRRSRQAATTTAEFTLRFHRCFQCVQSGDCAPTSASRLIMSLPQLLRLVNLSADIAPVALQRMVRFSEVTAVLLVQEKDAKMCIAGRGMCGPCKGDSMLFFSKLVGSADQPAWTNTDNASLPCGFERLIHAQVCRWLRLHCPPVVNPVVFPQLAALTAGRCLEPLYQYTLCQTEGDVELSDEQQRAFEDDYHWAASRDDDDAPVHPIRLRPMNAVFAIQPHLPSGHLELPLTALDAVPEEVTASAHSDTTPPSSSPSSSSSSLAFVQLAQGSLDLFRLCLDFLDTNSLLFGVMPAMHSLSSVWAALTSAAYGRRVLVSRYGTWSDVALWSGELLVKWRTRVFEVRTTVVKHLVECTTQLAKIQVAMDRANMWEAHWAAVYDFQRRVNRYLVGVMRQHRADVLPQLYTRAATAQSAVVRRHGCVRPIFFTAPDAAMRLLLCAPPFTHMLLSSVGDINLATSQSLTLGERDTELSQHHYSDFAGFMSRESRMEDGLWSLYMGPVYVYENEHTAGMGCEVDVDEVSKRFPRLAQRDGRANDGEVGETGPKQRAVRQLFISDPNQLPVTRRMPFEGSASRQRRFQLYGSSADVHLYSRTLAACFRARGIDTEIESKRSWWAEQVVAAEGDESDAKDDVGETRAGAETERRVNIGLKLAMSDRCGAQFEYVESLMHALFAPVVDAPTDLLCRDPD